MTKFQRAKKQTIKKMDKILEMIVSGEVWEAGVVFNDAQQCGFCEFYRDGFGHWVDRYYLCKGCPLTGYVPCYRKLWFRQTHWNLIMGDTDEAIPRILAIKMWIESLEE